MVKITDDEFESYIGKLAREGVSEQVLENYTNIDREICIAKENFKNITDGKLVDKQLWEVLNQRNIRKRKLSRRKIKVLFIIAAVIGTWFASSLAITSNRNYVFTQEQRGDGSVVLNNAKTQVISKISKEEEAYIKILSEIGIDTMMIYDRPTDMTFKGYIVKVDNAEMYWDYKGNMITLNQGVINEEGLAFKGGQKVAVASNEWINQEIEIMSQDTDGEYASVVVKNNAYYILSGIIDLEDFKMIAQDLNIKKN